MNLSHDVAAKHESQEVDSIAIRCIWTLVWFAIVSVGTNARESWGSWSGISLAGPLIILIGLVGMVAVWTIPPSRQARFELVAFFAALGTVLAVNGPVLATSRFFNTDSAAFNQLATQLLLKGRNPYFARFRPSMLQLKPVAEFWTYTLSGGHVSQVSYPAGSFVIQAPVQLLGIHHLTTDWLDLFAWLGAAILLYVVSPRNIKWLAPLLVLASLFTFQFTHGGTDALFVPFLMIAVLRWDDFVWRRGPRNIQWLGPVALGIACSIKQGPWLCVPFLIIGIAMEAHRHEVPVARTVLRYAALVALPFTLVNLPFFIWSPSAWIRGSFLPLTQPLVPDGQGLVSIATHGLARVVYPRDLEFIGALLMLALLSSFVLWYPQMKRTWLLAVPIVLFVFSRSLSTYLVDFVPAAFVAILTTSQVDGPRGVTRMRVLRVGVVVPLTLAIVGATFAFTSPPLSIQVVHYQSTNHGQFLGPLTLTISNNTDHTIKPHIMVVIGARHPAGFWTPLTPRKAQIPAHASVMITYLPPAFLSAPRRNENWLVEATSMAPEALTTSPTLSWRPDAY